MKSRKNDGNRSLDVSSHEVMKVKNWWRVLVPMLVLFGLLGVSDRAGAFDQSHRAFTGILGGHLKGKQVNYAALKAKPAPLDAYLGQLAAVSRAEFDGWNEKQRLAFLINLYNAATLKLVVDHYPVKSIKDIGGAFKGPWKLQVVRVFGQLRTLDQVEHEMIRPVYKEPRAHFALNCASIGCPTLRYEAYQATKLDAQLDEQGRVFMRDASKNRVDLKKKRLYLSPVFKWFESDFVEGGNSVESFVAPFFPEELRPAVLGGGLKRKYTDYNWKLNRQ